MKKAVRNLLVVAMLGIASVGAFAQKQGQGRDQDKRPPKETVKVVDRKDNRPPPQPNTNQPKRGDRKRP